MHPVDLANWREIDALSRPVTWADLIGHPDGADYLTSAGRSLSLRMNEDLEAFFGPEWLPLALGQNSGHPTVPSLARQSPVFAIRGPQWAAGSFIELVRWWASIETQRRRPGMGRVRHDTQQDASLPRFLHTLTVARLGAIAESLGASVVFEPTPGDLLLNRDGVEVTVEVFAMRSAREVELQVLFFDEIEMHLAKVSKDFDVYFHGSIPGRHIDVDAWTGRVASVAAQAARLGIEICVDEAGAQLFVAPGSAPTGTELSGPPLEVDVGQRIRDRLQTKSRQVAGADPVWLWVENHGAVDLMTPFYDLPVREQVSAFRDLAVPALQGLENVAGVTFSGAAHRKWPPQSKEEVFQLGGRGLRQPLALDRSRISLQTLLCEGSVATLMWDLLAGEEGWLDWALNTLHVECRAEELVQPLYRNAQPPVA